MGRIRLLVTSKSEFTSDLSQNIGRIGRALLPMCGPCNFLVFFVLNNKYHGIVKVPALGSFLIHFMPGSHASYTRR